MRSPRSSTVLSGVLAVLAAMNFACAKKTVRKPPSGLLRVIAADRLPEPRIQGGGFSDTPLLKAIGFDLDRYDLRKEARDILGRNAEVLRKNPGWRVLIEGHCDERGTTGYNLALGQKRAQAVREYYLLLGFSGDRIATISYGEEKPACLESTEDCWADNRRAENKAGSGSALNGEYPG